VLVLKVIYPGSFDPVTYGHLDIIERSSNLFEHVVVALFVNSGKSPLFSLDERQSLLTESVKHLPNVTVDRFTGLLVQYMSDKDIRGIVKGLRAVSDYEYELQMALMNKQMYPLGETIFLPSSTEYSYLSSSIVRELSKHGADISTLVPEHVVQALHRKFQV
jgi:pantetheine-phosphate adenylyltransferase